MDMTFHHTGIVVPSRDAATRYHAQLGLPVMTDEYVADFDCDCIFLGTRTPCVELIVPHSGHLAAFNAGRGGIHHVAYRVADLRRFMSEFNRGQSRWLRSEPFRGARGMLVNFLSPRDLVCLTEFVEERP